MKKTIDVQNLRRDFRVYQKGEGMREAFRSLFWRRWETVHAVSGLTFSVEPGEFVGFLGPNGAGKTTTLKMLSGILAPTSGTCRVLGFDPFKRDRVFRQSVSMVMGQKSQLIWDLPAMDTFALHRDMYRIPPGKWKKTLDTLVELMNVGHILQTPVRQLSLGERMKCETIVSLLHSPKVLFLDEPTIGLDVISQHHLWEFLHEYQQKEETTIMLTSHNMQDISNLCSRVLVINLGALVYDGKLNELVNLTQPLKEVSFRLEKELNKSEQSEMKKILSDADYSLVDGQLIRFFAPRNRFSSIVRKLLQHFPIEDLSLEEVDFSVVMKESFLMRPEEVPLRKLKGYFNDKIGKITEN
jgi:ABC-2 type transport system ATP-binding protein